MASIVITTKSKHDLELIISLSERLNCSVIHLPDAANRLIESKNLIDSVTRIIRQSESLKFLNPENTERNEEENIAPKKKSRTKKAASRSRSKR
jgi:hypothetical protein